MKIYNKKPQDKYYIKLEQLDDNVIGLVICDEDGYSIDGGNLLMITPEGLKRCVGIDEEAAANLHIPLNSMDAITMKLNGENI